MFSSKHAGAASLLFKAAAEKNTAVMRTKTVDEHRELITRLAELRPVLPNMTVEAADCAAVPCNWVYRHDAGTGKVILYIHGGSWMLGNLKTAQMPGELLAVGCDCRVLVIDYRLSPEHPFPAGLEDCLAAFDFLLENGYTENDIALFGDSAGGNLSLALLNKLKALGRKLPAAVGLASPVTDMTPESEILKSRDNLIYTVYKGAETDIFTLYTGEHDRKSPLLSPLYGDFDGLPPVLIHVGGDEPLSLDCVAFAKKAYERGVDISLRVFKDMFHDFSIVGVTLKESRESIGEFCEFFTKHLELINNI